MEKIWAQAVAAQERVLGSSSIPLILPSEDLFLVIVFGSFSSLTIEMLFSLALSCFIVNF